MKKEPKKFRHLAGFGKRMEHWIFGLMMKEGIDVYLPVVDDMGIDAVIRKPNGQFIEIQIKARSDNVVMGDGALFAGITHELRKNYYFIFYSERHEAFWVLSSRQFIKEARQNKSGKNKGKRTLWMNGKKKIKGTDKYQEHLYERYDKYRVTDFSQFKK